MTATLKTDLTVKDICEGFVYTLDGRRPIKTSLVRCQILSICAFLHVGASDGAGLAWCLLWIS